MNAFGRCKGGGRRSARRENTPLIAVFTTITHSHRALVVDVSATGVRLRGSDLPPSGEALEISIECVRAFGIVMWSHDGECGIGFDDPLTAGEVASLRHRVTTMAGLSPQVKAALDDWMAGFAR